MSEARTDLQITRVIAPVQTATVPHLPSSAVLIEGLPERVIVDGSELTDLGHLRLSPSAPDEPRSGLCPGTPILRHPAGSTGGHNVPRSRSDADQPQRSGGSKICVMAGSSSHHVCQMPPLPLPRRARRCTSPTSGAGCRVTSRAVCPRQQHQDPNHPAAALPARRARPAPDTGTLSPGRPGPEHAASGTGCRRTPWRSSRPFEHMV